MTEEVETTDEAPQRSLIVQIQFDAENIYSSRIDRPAGQDDEGFATAVAQIVERTVALHLGALPVLAKQEVSA